jgi:hypothetical protein
MWNNKQTLLSQSLNLQMFLCDAKQAQVLLSQQDNFLSKEEVAVSRSAYTWQKKASSPSFFLLLLLIFYSTHPSHLRPLLLPSLFARVRGSMMSCSLLLFAHRLHQDSGGRKRENLLAVVHVEWLLLTHCITTVLLTPHTVMLRSSFLWRHSCHGPVVFLSFLSLSLSSS